MLHSIRGTIWHRILINYWTQPAQVADVLPPPFRPRLVGGSGRAGDGLIRRDIDGH